MYFDPNKSLDPNSQYYKDLLVFITKHKNIKCTGKSWEYVSIVDQKIKGVCVFILEECTKYTEKQSNPSLCLSYNTPKEKWAGFTTFDELELLIKQLFKKTYNIDCSFYSDSTTEFQDANYYGKFCTPIFDHKQHLVRKISVIWTPGNEFIYGPQIRPKKYEYNPESIPCKLYQAALKQEGTDFSFKVKYQNEKEVTFYSHRFILVTNSNFWKTTLNSGLTISTFDDFPAKIYQLYLEFVYTGIIKQDCKTEDIIGLASLAEKCCEKNLWNFCFDYLKNIIDGLDLSHPDRFMYAYKIGSDLSMEEFVIKCLKFADKNGEGLACLYDFMNSKDWNDSVDLKLVADLAKKHDLQYVLSLCMERSLKLLNFDKK